MGATQNELRQMPEEVRSELGFALFLLQTGMTPDGTRAFGEGLDRRICKLSCDGEDRNSYRLAFTAAFPQVIYVLDVFAKKSKRGIATPKKDRDRVARRFRLALDHYQQALKGTS